MGRRVAKFFSDHSRDLISPDEVDRRVSNFGDVELEFLEDAEMSSGGSSNSHKCYPHEITSDADDDDAREGDGNNLGEEDKEFWENQQNVLQATLCRTSPLESRIRQATKEALKEIQTTETICACGNHSLANACRKCLMREVSRRLRIAGFDCAICKTKWRRSSRDIPSGEHDFVDVIDNSSLKKGQARVIVELNFRAEFEMVRGSEEYNRLVRRLPEVFVGKVERLNPVIKVMCMAAKRCLKEKKMHMGPWRKQKYVQAKWLSACDRTLTTASPLWPVANSIRLLPKPKASMLTVDLLGSLPHVQQFTGTAVAVV